jgi:hypothetical protein
MTGARFVSLAVVPLTLAPLLASAAAFLDFTYQSSLNQVFTTPTSGTFSERGQVSFLSPNNGFSGQFTDTGTFTNIFTNAGLTSTATFNTFQFQIFQGSQLVGSTTTFNSGQATLIPTSPTTLTGTFMVDAKFQPIGPTFSGYDRLSITGTVTASGGEVAAGRYLSGIHTGTGTATLLSPEPATFILIGTGATALAGLRWLNGRRRDRRTAANGQRWLA